MHVEQAQTLMNRLAKVWKELDDIRIDCHVPLRDSLNKPVVEYINAANIVTYEALQHLEAFIEQHKS